MQNLFLPSTSSLVTAEVRALIQWLKSYKTLSHLYLRHLHHGVVRHYQTKKEEETCHQRYPRKEKPFQISLRTSKKIFGILVRSSPMVTVFSRHKSQFMAS